MKILLAITLLAPSLAGCALIEPSATRQFNVKPGTPAETVFACAEKTIHAFKRQQAAWRADVTARDADHGVLETGLFDEINISGIRTQLKYTATTGSGKINIKASGPYFADLGADIAASQLAAGLSQCE